MSRTEGKVFLGFNRPLSRFGRIIAERLAAESGPGMYNWFVARVTRSVPTIGT